MKRLLPLALCIAMLGCSHAAYQVHPGAGGYVSGTPTGAQLFDSQEYDALVATNSVNQSVEADYLANKFPTSAMPKIKAAVNASVEAYNTANSQWLTFDAALKAGASPSQAALASAIAAMQTALSQLTTAKGGN